MPRCGPVPGRIPTRPLPRPGRALPEPAPARLGEALWDSSAAWVYPLPGVHQLVWEPENPQFSPWGGLGAARLYPMGALTALTSRLSTASSGSMTGPAGIGAILVPADAIF